MGELRCLSVATLADRWGCPQEKVLWMIANGHLRAFSISVGKPNRRSYRVRPDVAAQIDPSAIVVTPEALQQYALKPKASPPVLSPLAASIQEAARTPCTVGPPTYIYFVQCEGFVKVGHSYSPQVRFGALKCSTPFDLILLKTIHGTRTGERAVQSLLVAYHHRFEWFHLRDDLMAAIKELPRGTKPHMPLSKRAQFARRLDEHVMSRMVGADIRRQNREVGP